MNFYFDSLNRLNISGSEYTAMPEKGHMIKEIYKFNHISLSLGTGFTQFLNTDIDKWGNSLKSLILDLKNNCNENNVNEYISKAETVFSEIAYLTVYRALLYNQILVFYKHPNMLKDICEKIYDFFETREANPLEIPAMQLHDIDIHPKDKKTFVYRGEIDRLKDIQFLFSELTQLCLYSDVENSLNELYKHQDKTFRESFYKLSPENILQYVPMPDLTRFEVNQIDKNKYDLVEVTSTNDVYDICYKEFMQLISKDLRVKQCDNCKKYFVPENRYDTIYCDECKNAGAAMKKYQDKIKKNPVLAAYNKAYQAKYAKLVKPYKNNAEMKEIKLKDLRTWVYEAKNKIAELEKIDDDKRDNAIQELILWLNRK